MNEAPPIQWPFIQWLETSGLPYCITGSIASGIYGKARFTTDNDFVLLNRTPWSAPALATAL